MRRTLPCKRSISVLATLALLLLVATAVLSTHFGEYVPAGEQIGNEAIATYQDNTGKTRTIASNSVTTTVQQVAAVLLVEDGAKSAAPGVRIIYPHTLTNTGNGTDTFDLSSVQATGDDFDLLDVVFYRDADQDGLPDDQNPITDTGQVAPFQPFSFVMLGTVPSAVVAGDVSIVTVTATSRFDPTVSESNTDTTTSTGQAVIDLTKSMDQTEGASPSGPYTITLTYTNNGNNVAHNLTLTDVIPQGMTYVPGSGRWSLFPDTPLGDGSGADPPGIEYDYGVTASGTVTTVIAAVDVGATAKLSFQVILDAGLHAGTIDDTAELSYDDGTGTIITGTPIRSRSLSRRYTASN